MSASPSEATADSTATPSGIDPRGPQFNAAVTAVIVILALVLPQPYALILTALQTVFFIIGVSLGVQRTPHAWAFRTFIRPRLSAPSELEDPAPPRFAQGVGLVFAAVALVAYVVGATLVAQIALGLALVASLLNAIFRFCLGCEMYLLIKRLA